MKQIFSNPNNFLFGTGWGSFFFNAGRDAMNNTSELSYLEIIRNGGIFELLLLCFFWFMPIRRIWHCKEKRYVVVAYVGYLIIAGTNPLLLSTTAFLMYLYVYWHYYKLKYANEGDIFL